MVRNVAVEAEKDTRMIKAAVHPEGGALNPRLFIGMLGGILSIQMTILGGSFQVEVNKPMLSELMEICDRNSLGSLRIPRGSGTSGHHRPIQKNSKCSICSSLEGPEKLMFRSTGTDNTR